VAPVGFKEGVLPKAARRDQGSRLQPYNSLQQPSTCGDFGDRKTYIVTLQSLFDIMKDVSPYAAFEATIITLADQNLVTGRQKGAEKENDSELTKEDII
jgi:hypothetical protein